VNHFNDLLDLDSDSFKPSLFKNYMICGSDFFVGRHVGLNGALLVPSSALQ